MSRPRARPCLGSRSRCPNLTTNSSGRCDSCRRTFDSERNRERDAQRPSPSQRGYGREHRKLRERWEARIASGETVICSKPGCGQQIHPYQQWDLGHAPDRSWRGPEHRSCNRATRGPSRRRPEPPAAPRGYEPPS